MGTNTKTATLTKTTAGLFTSNARALDAKTLDVSYTQQGSVDLRFGLELTDYNGRRRPWLVLQIHRGSEFDGGHEHEPFSYARLWPQKRIGSTEMIPPYDKFITIRDRLRIEQELVYIDSENSGRHGKYAMLLASDMGTIAKLWHALDMLRDEKTRDSKKAHTNDLQARVLKDIRLLDNLAIAVRFQ